MPIEAYNVIDSSWFFNFVEDSPDRNGKLPNNLEKDRQVLFDWNKIKTDFDLVDTFRILNPLSRRYSFTHQNKKSRSRIDRIYVTDKESGKIMRQGFIDTPWRDHKIITVEMNETSERGPGQWALNTDLLKDPKFLEEVEDQWKYFAQAKDKFASKLAWWDRAKAMVKTIAMIYSIHKKQIQSDLEKLLSNERLRLESLLDQKYSEQTERELECILKRQKELLLKKSEGYRIRARIPNFEENEPNISYYSRMEKIKAEGNKIHSLYDKNGILQSKAANVLKIAEDYYSDLFRASETDKKKCKMRS